MKMKKNYVLNPNILNSTDDNKETQSNKQKSTKNGFVNKKTKKPINYVLNPNRLNRSHDDNSHEIIKNGKSIHSPAANEKPVRPPKRKTTEQSNSLKKVSKTNHHSNGYNTNENLLTDSIIVAKILKHTDNTKNIDFINNWYRQFETIVVNLKPTFYDEKRWLQECQAAGLPPVSFNLIKSCIHVNGKKQGIQIDNIKKIQIIGSHRLNTCINIDTETIDICVEIPQTALEKVKLTDTNCYYKLKLLYLSHLAVNLLRSSHHVSKCNFEYLQNDPFQPILMLRPTDKPKNILFAIHAICGGINTTDTQVKEKTKNFINSFAKPTSCQWKNTIARDLALLKNENFIFDKISGQNNICQAIRLIKIWLTGHGIDSHMFSGYIITEFAVYLLEKNKLKLSMDVMDVIRVIWLNLGKFSKCC